VNRQLVLVVGQRTDVGRVRDHNEDNLATVPPEGVPAEVLERKGQLFLVADGMGGHAAGATASSIATQQIMQNYYQDDSLDLRASLERAIRQANTAIFEQALENLTYAGMGTTLVAAVCQDSRFLIANVGDSRAYLIRDGGIRQLTQDHSWVAEAVRQGTLSIEQARHHPRRNVITRSLGNRPEVEVDFFEEGLLPGDTLVLCSDGLSGPVYDEEIRDLVLALEPQAAADQLVDLANERGGPDNITVVIVRAVQTPPVETPASGGASKLAILGCLGMLVAAGGLAAAALWAGGGWPPAFLIPPTPAATITPPAIPGPGTGQVTPLPTSVPGPAATDTPTLPTPTGVGGPYPVPNRRAPDYPTRPSAYPPAPSPGQVQTPTMTSTPTVTITGTVTTTPTSTVTTTPTSTVTTTPTSTVTPTALDTGPTTTSTPPTATSTP